MIALSYIIGCVAWVVASGLVVELLRRWDDDFDDDVARVFMLLLWPLALAAVVLVFTAKALVAVGRIPGRLFTSKPKALPEARLIERGK